MTGAQRALAILALTAIALALLKLAATVPAVLPCSSIGCAP